MVPKTPPRFVIYVDDDPDICEIVQAALSLIAGIEVRTALTGEKAMEYSESRPPDLFILDMMMPGLDGPSTLRSLRDKASLKNIPVIFLTAKVMPREVVQVLELGAIGVIAKPFDPLKLGENIMALWNNDVPSRAVISSSVGHIAPKGDPLTENFLERARTDIIGILEMLGRVRQGDSSLLSQIAHVAHSLHGTGALFGFLGVSATAGALETRIDGIVASAAAPQLLLGSVMMAQIDECAAQLAGAIAAAAQIEPNGTAMFQ